MTKIKANKIQINDAKDRAVETLKTDDHDVKIVVDDDQAGSFIDVYVDGQHVAEINVDNSTGIVGLKQKAKTVKKRFRDEKTGKLD